MKNVPYRIPDSSKRPVWKSVLFYCWFPLLILYLEFIFSLFAVKKIGLDFFLIAAFTVPSGLLLDLVCGLFPRRANLVVASLLTFLLPCFYSLHITYFRLFHNFLSVYSLFGGAGQVLEFSEQIGSGILSSLGSILLNFLPTVFFFIFSRKLISFERKKWRQSVLTGTGTIGSHFLCLLLLLLPGKELYSPYDLYYHTNAPQLSLSCYGLLPTARLDLQRMIFGFEETTGGSVNMPESNPVSSESNTDSAPAPSVIDRSPNILPIDFGQLIDKESNQTIKQMHQYFQSVKPTNKNKYTGMFRGYNLILLTAEGFAPYAINRELTPTLYRLTHEGFVFNNFYTSLWGVSTSDGEYVACTGLIPKSGVWSLYQSGKNKNLFPFALGNQFCAAGYSTRAYHNHTYNYYHRDISHPNLGYDYKGVGNGLTVKQTWPESDLEMIEVTTPEYIKDEPFHTYYMTVSGHMLYTFSGNYIASKNRALVDHLPYSDEAKAYLACQIELDRALEKLIFSLEEAGIAEKTVIALSPDHYPYGLPKDKIDELAGHKVEENFELYKETFILWKKGMEPVVVDKPCSSLDILPTISNLFGLSYDSRLLMGTDILSDSVPLVIFGNRNFITDKVMYDNKTKQIIPLSGEQLPDGYISSVKQLVNQKFIYSAKILDNDYYRKVWDGIKK